MANFNQILHSAFMDKKAAFYIVTAMGLSELAVIEFKHKWPLAFPDVAYEIKEVEPGGFLLETSLQHGFLLNNLLKTPTKILVRFAEFKARDFPKLFQKISKLPWSDFLLGQLPEVEVAAHESRLFDSRKIEKAIHDGIIDFYRRQPIKKRYQEAWEKSDKTNAPKIFFRNIEDTITLSLDTTGELLHKRGEKTLTGHTPIRENLATLLLLSLLGDEVVAENPRELVDPMCGSGTFLIEAANFWKPTLERTFAYELMPDWIDSQFKKQLKAKLIFDHAPLFQKLKGFEVDVKIVKLANENIQSLPITIKEADAFSNCDQAELDRLMIVNPPYGIRVGENINSAFYKKLVDELLKNMNPKKLGIIIPEEHDFFHPKVRSMRAFKNGGLDVVFYILDCR